MSNQIMEQQVDFNIIIDSLAIADTSSASFHRDTIYLFYKPEELSFSDSLCLGLVNPQTTKVQTGDYGFLPKAKSQYIPNWTIGIILLLLVLLGTIRSASNGYLAQIFQSVFNRKVANRLFREKISTLLHVSFQLDVFYVLVTGILIFQIADYYSGFSSNEGLLYCGIIVGAFVLYITLKYSLYRISGFIFDTTAETREYLFHAKTGNRVSGLILFPVVLFLFLVKGENAEFLLYFGILLTLILAIISILRGMVIIAQKVFSVYYMILYLCTLEILPLLIVGRILWID